MKYDYLIIGGGIAGVTAAETIRGKDAGARIGIIASEPHLPYSRVLLPSFLKKKVSREHIFLRTEDDFIRTGIHLMRGRTAVSVDSAARQVRLSDGEDIVYEKLLIAAGGSVHAWPQRDTGERIFRLQTLDDADRLSAALDTIRRPIVIGSSFIALEFIEIFLMRGIAPRVLVRGERFFDDMLDAQGAALLHEHMAARGISLLCRDEALTLKEEGGAVRIATRAHGTLDADAVAIGIGIARNIGFLLGGGIACGDQGVSTNEFLETNSPGVFAAGDIAACFDPVAGRHRSVGNWTNAVLQGTRAGMNMAGERTPFSSVPTYSIVNLGLNITALGACDGALQSVSRSNRTARQYERFFMRDGILVGAFLINRFADKPLLASLIGQRAAIGQYTERLRDMSFDIRELSAII